MKKQTRMLSLLLCLVLVLGLLPAIQAEASMEDPTKFDVTIAKTTDAGYELRFPDVVLVPQNQLPAEEQAAYPEGRLLVAFYKNTSHVTAGDPALIKSSSIQIVESRDSGRTWSEPVTVIDQAQMLAWGLSTAECPAEARDPNFFLLNDGTVILTFFTTMWDDITSDHGVYIVMSKDGGKTWDKQTPPFEVQHTYNGFCAKRGDITQFANGDVLIPVYSSSTAYGILYSYDATTQTLTKKGEAEVRAANEPSGSRDPFNEVSFCATLDEEKPGTVYAFARQPGYVYVSEDYGMTWSWIATAETEIHQPGLKLLPDGRIFATWSRTSGPRPIYGKIFDPELGWNATASKLIFRWTGGGASDMADPSGVLLADNKTLLTIWYQTANQSILGTFAEFSDFVPEPEPFPASKLVLKDKTYDMAGLVPEEDGTATGWTSSDTAVAEITGAGVLKAKAKGTANISVTIGGEAKTCVVTVLDSKVALSDDFETGNTTVGSQPAGWDRNVSAADNSFQVAKDGDNTVGYLNDNSTASTPHGWIKFDPVQTAVLEFDYKMLTSTADGSNGFGLFNMSGSDYAHGHQVMIRVFDGVLKYYNGASWIPLGMENVVANQWYKVRISLDEGSNSALVTVGNETASVPLIQRGASVNALVVAGGGSQPRPDQFYVDNVVLTTAGEEAPATIVSVENQINAIGTVDLTKEAAIEAAREAYDSLPAAQQALVPAETLQTLEAAEMILQALKTAAQTLYAMKGVTYGMAARMDVTGTATWTSSDTTVATVDTDGRMTTLKAGTTTVTAVVGSETKTVNVVVSEGTVQTENFESGTVGQKPAGWDNISTQTTNNDITVAEENGNKIGKVVDDANTSVAAHVLLPIENRSQTVKLSFRIKTIRDCGKHAPGFGLFTGTTLPYGGDYKPFIRVWSDDSSLRYAVPSASYVTMPSLGALADNTWQDVTIELVEGETTIKVTLNDKVAYIPRTGTSATAQYAVFAAGSGSAKGDEFWLDDIVITTVAGNAADSQEADAVKALINAIGTVDLTKETAIVAARQAYNALTTAQRAQIDQTTYGVLTAAEAALAQLKNTNANQAAADAAKAKIEAIGTVTLDSEAAITEARAAYDALTTAQKELVDAATLKVLTDAEAALKALKDAAAADKAAADAVKEQIEAIGTVTLDSEDAIEAARAAYDALTDTQKALVGAETLKVLTDAEAVLEDLKQPGTHKPATPGAPSKPVEKPTASVLFADVAKTDWYYEAVQYAAANGLMNGTGAGKFSPEATTSRGMIVTILWRLEKEPNAAAAGYTDVASNAYYADAIDWAKAEGIVDGYGNGMFGADDAITREQLAAILYRYAQYKGYDTDARADLSAFADAAKVSGWAKEAMQWAVAEGLINGMDGALAPQGDAIRAQGAAILQRFCEYVVKK